MDGLKPKIEYEKPMGLFDNPGDFDKIYRCPDCGARLRLGQMICKCGLPILWEGVAAWDKLQKARRR